MLLHSPTHFSVCALVFTDPRKWVMDLKTGELLIQVPCDYFGHQECQEISDRCSRITLSPPLNLPQRQIALPEKKKEKEKCHEFNICQGNLTFLSFSHKFLINYMSDDVWTLMGRKLCFKKRGDSAVSCSDSKHLIFSGHNWKKNRQLPPFWLCCCCCCSMWRQSSLFYR